MTDDYNGCKLVNIRRGKGERACYIYAHLLTKDSSKILISATLDYILLALPKRVSKEHLDFILNAVTGEQAELLKEVQNSLPS
jgi:hypothetical protein